MANAPATTSVRKIPSKNGGQTWVLTIDGARRTVTSSATSVTAMENIADTYSVALQRLADR